MKSLFFRGLFAVATAALGLAAQASEYVPPRHDWAPRAPDEAGFDPRRLAEAVDWIQANTVVEPADLHRLILDTYTPREPGYRVLGPTRPRVGGSGMVVRGGHLVAVWGDIHRADMTFSVAKSYLSTLAGLALADGRIASLDEPVSRHVDDGKLDGEHNGAITWRHLLEQNSDWSGTLWDTPDWADRPEGDDPANRPLHAPGTRYKYNDVRVNLLAYALLQVFRQPLPQVLRERIMDPIGASNTWRWYGYENSWVELDGQRMQSVSGGGHFGGGLFISTADHARFGLLHLRDGRWGEARLFPADWMATATTPSATKDDYGLLWWLNTGRRAIPEAPESACWAAGFGGNYIYVDRENDLVIVLRWVPDYAGAIGRVLGALRGT